MWKLRPSSPNAPLLPIAIAWSECPCAQSNRYQNNIHTYRAYTYIVATVRTTWWTPLQTLQRKLQTHRVNPLYTIVDWLILWPTFALTIEILSSFKSGEINNPGGYIECTRKKPTRRCNKYTCNGSVQERGSYTMFHGCGNPNVRVIALVVCENI